ncbi:putative addiction module antidote protein [Bradyrhizobium sp. USDA 377]
MAKTRPFDSAEYLDSPEAIAAYLSEAFETNDPAFITEAIGTIARARGMTAVAKDAGLSREHLYRALSSEGKPEFGTVLKVLGSLGIHLHAEPKVAEVA